MPIFLHKRISIIENNMILTRANKEKNIHFRYFATYIDTLAEQNSPISRPSEPFLPGLETLIFLYNSLSSEICS